MSRAKKVALFRRVRHDEKLIRRVYRHPTEPLPEPFTDGYPCLHLRKEVVRWGRNGSTRPRNWAKFRYREKCSGLGMSWTTIGVYRDDACYRRGIETPDFSGDPEPDEEAYSESFAEAL